jgi:cytochrome b6-f complex iron-sulfur subunit
MGHALDNHSLKTRRNFLGRFVKTGFASLAFLSGSVFFTFLYPSRIKKQDLIFSYALDEEELPRRGVRKVEVPLSTAHRTVVARAFIVNYGGEIFGLSSVCRHLGCLVEWSGTANLFVCPCHGGKYDITGRVVAGPPSSSLARMPLKVQEGKVYMGFMTG